MWRGKLPSAVLDPSKASFPAPAHHWDVVWEKVKWWGDETAWGTAEDATGNDGDEVMDLEIHDGRRSMRALVSIVFRVTV
jgi:hypothetical protein